VSGSESLNMKITLQVKLLPSSTQHTALVETMHAFNAACTYIAGIAYEQRLASKFKLQRLVYYEVRQRFGLSAQLTIRAIAKVVEAYKRDKSHGPRPPWVSLRKRMTRRALTSRTFLTVWSFFLPL
jgi:predicted transposase